MPSNRYMVSKAVGLLCCFFITAGAITGCENHAA